jgi:DNA/RNA endonuclease G (NUC1)/predicted extracellular nuclease
MSKFAPRARSRSRLFPVLAVIAVGLAFISYQMFSARRVQAISSTIVISQVYGGGGNGGSTYKNDFIELFNRGNSVASLSGWSVQYAATTGTSWQKTDLTGVTLQPGQYYLVQESQGAGGTVNLPTPDASGSIAMAAGAGKVALMNNQTVITSGTLCPSGATVVDFVGFGSGTNCFEGPGPTPTISASASASRGNLGCTDTDNNASDFSSGAVNPRNTASPTHPCTSNQAIVPTCPGSVSTTQGTPTSAPVSATDPDGTVTSATIMSTPVSGITLDSFTPAAGIGGTANATLNVANTTLAGTYSVVIRYSNNDPTPQTADCTVAVTVNQPNQPIIPNCPASLNVNQGSSGFGNVSARDADGTVTSASIISAPVTGITLDSVTPAGGTGGTATATLNVANTTAVGSYNVTIRYTNNDATPQTADCTVVVNINIPPGIVVISQIYGGGGNTGSTLENDYIELINHSSAPVNLNGWSVQAWSFASNSWEVTPLTNFTLQPGQYYLVQESQGAGGTEHLPTPDAIGAIAISSGSTKVALVSNTTPISTACPGAFVDLVGYGTDPVIGTCHEGSGAAPQVSNTIAIQRRYEGCFDTDQNADDFVTIAPNPHNTSSAFHDCTGLSAFGAANPSTVVQGESSTLTVKVASAQNPASTGTSVTADLSSIGGSASQAFAGSGNVFTYTALVPANNPPGMKSLPVTVTDAETHTANTNILLSILPIIPDHVTISQVYGGGGNASATYSNDYVELYNPTAATISLTGWSLQYGPATGTTFTGKTVIGGSIAPGAYYLISLASQNTNVGGPLPTASVSGDINLAAGAGKIVLVRNSDTLAGQCPVGTDPDIVDFVGYGTTANCHEGNANAPGPGNNTTALFRKNNGGTDTDQNGNDFVLAAANPRSTSPVAEFGPSVAGTDPATNSTTAPYDSSITVFFSEPVTVDSGWYNITCTVTGAHASVTEAHTNDLKTYSVTPNSSFQFGEQCTVTITKAAVHDVDMDDSQPDTDTLAADYVWSFTVVGPGDPAPYPPSVHLTMGNPSGADIFQPLNYLMEKPTYSVSYNRDKGTPNWVSWHLDNTWYGTLARVDVFRPDPKVDPTWYRVQDFDYIASGFDRGHMTPNADRDNQNRIPINQETYLMTNIIPQAPDNNQGPWASLEAFLRTQTDAGNEIYIVSGPAGVGGTGSNGSATTIANGHVTVPAQTWKVALIIPGQSGNDISRVTCSSRALAVIMPNVQGIRNTPWQNFITTVDAVENLTGYNLFSNLPPAVQACIEAGTDGTNPPGTADQSAGTTEDNSVTVTLQALQSNSDPLTFSIMSNPASGSLGSVSAASCSSGTCTATVTYSPGADFNGSDSFTFRANDGSVHSNTSTVTIGVSKVNDSPSAAGDGKSTPEDTSLVFPSSDLTANDSAGPANESAQVLTVTSVTGGADTHGSVGLASGTVTYMPDANYSGPASFTYTVCDDGTTNGSPDSKCATATVSVDVQPINDNPVAVNDSASTNEDNSVTVDVVANDTDVDGDSLSLASVGSAAHGAVSIVSGKAVYAPAANYNGSDSFGYVVSDGHGGQANGVVSVTINPVNDSPTANSQSVNTNSNTPVVITLTGSDVETPSGSLTYTVTSGPSHGSLSGTGANRTYTPGLNYSGPDSFQFTVTDNGDGSSPALTSSAGTVSITVNDTVGPTVTLNGNSISLWPPNHNYHTVNVSDLVASASDNFDPHVNLNSVVITQVTSDEIENGNGDGNTMNDIVIAPDCKSVQLRAERDGDGDGRVYTLTFLVRDTAGNTTTATAKVTVPKNNGATAVDSGPHYMVNSTCH